MHQQKLLQEFVLPADALIGTMAIITQGRIDSMDALRAEEAFIDRAKAAHEFPLTSYASDRHYGIPQVWRMTPTATVNHSWDSVEGLATLDDLMSRSRVVVLTGGMGTAKTKAMMKQAAKLRTLYLVPARTLGDQLMSNLKDACWASDITGVDADGYALTRWGRFGSVVACLPSLPKTQGVHFDMQILDEATVYPQQLSSEMCMRNERTITRVLRGQLHDPNIKTVLMDANMTPDTVTALFGQHTNYVTGHSTLLPMQCDVELMAGSKSDVTAALFAGLEAGSTYYLTTDSKAYAREVGIEAVDRGIRCLVVTGDSKNDRAQWAWRTEQPHFWENHAPQLVITTNTIGAGFSIEGINADRFDEVWQVATGSINQSPASYAQQLFRVRSKAKRRVWIAKASNGEAYQDSSIDAIPGTEAWAARHDKEKRSLRDYFLTYLLGQGCTISSVELPKAPKADKSIKQRAKQYRVDRVKHAATLTAERYEDQKRERYNASAQLAEIEKYELLQRYGGTLADAQWDLEINPSWAVKIERATYLLNFDLAAAAFQPDADTYDSTVSSVASWAVRGLSNVFSAYLEPLIAYMQGKHTDASGDSDRWYHFQQNWEAIAAAFTVRGCKTYQAFVGRMFANVGLKRQNQKVNGVRVYFHNAEHFALWSAAVKVGTAAIDKVKAAIERVKVAAGGVVKRTIKLVMETLAIPTKEEQVALAWSRRVESNFGKPYMAFCEQVAEWMDELCKGDVEHLIALDARFEKIRDGKTDADFNDPQFRDATKTAIVQYFEAMTNPTEADAPLLIIDRAAIAQTVPAVIQTKSWAVVADYVVQQHLMPGLTSEQQEDSAWHLGRAAADKFARGYVQCVETFIEVADFMLSGLDAEIERLSAGGATIG